MKNGLKDDQERVVCLNLLWLFMFFSDCELAVSVEISIQNLQLWDMGEAH